MNNKSWTLVFLAWLTSLISVAGSLFFSEVMKYPPCTLCWYQRIFMFPLVFLLLAALFPLQSNTPRFVLPLSISGSLVALYHLFLYYGVIPVSYSPCREGASCLTRFFEFGIISIPLLSFLSFLFITMLVIFSHKGLAREK